MSDASPATDPAPPVDESTIYVTTQGTQVGKSHDRLVVRAVSEHALQTESAAEHGDEGGPEKEKTEVDLPVTLTSFPIKHVETVNLFGSGVDPTAGLFSVANQENITVNFFTTHGQFRGRFVPERSSVAVLHKQQHTLTDDTQLAISKQLVRGKITNALRYLRRKDTATGQATLKEALKKAASAATKQELRGAEGEAADAFFTGYGETLRDDWVFRERSRRPPEDHINALLSLMYTLTQQRCESALRAVNLDPYVGCFHVMRHGRPALALDLVEEFRRALADPFVARLVNRGTITHNDFTAENRLTDDAFDTVLGKYDGYLNKEVEHQATERSLTREEVLRLQATLLRKRITGELDEYPPFVIKQ